MRSLLRVVLAALIASSAVLAEYVDPSVLDACPGYNATHVSTHGSTLTATLVLAGQPCNVFGNDTKTLHLEVDYETGASSSAVIFQLKTLLKYSQSRVSMSRLRIPVTLATRSPTRFFPDPNPPRSLRTKQLSTSATPPPPSPSTSLAPLRRKSSSPPPLILSFGSPNTSASRPTSRRLLTSTALESPPTRSAWTLSTPPVPYGAETPTASLRERIFTETIRSISSIARPGRMGFSCSARTEWM